jgi:hypothetical protein
VKEENVMQIFAFHIVEGIATAMPQFKLVKPINLFQVSASRPSFPRINDNVWGDRESERCRQDSLEAIRRYINLK